MANETFQIKKAVRRALPIQVAFVGPTNSGKTYTALRFAAGLVPGGKIGVIDTEKGRASQYADDEVIMKELPQGYDVIELDPPYTPARFVGAIDQLERAGYDIAIIDNASDEWEGLGGCTDMAEAQNGMWNKAKKENKKLMSRISLSEMHIICCLKAQEKTKIVGKEKSDTGKQEYIPLGMQPICEKNFFYPMTLAFMVDAKTHEAEVIKSFNAIKKHFEKPHLITPKDGEVLRLWNKTGAKVGEFEQVARRAQEAARNGVAAYKEFWGSLNAAERKALASSHEENKRIAQETDKVATAHQPPVFGSEAEPVEWPDAFDGPELVWNGKLLRRDDDSGNYREVPDEAKPAADKAA